MVICGTLLTEILSQVVELKGLLSILLLALLALDVVDPFNFSESPRVPSGHKMPSVSLPPRLVENNVFPVIRKS